MHLITASQCMKQKLAGLKEEVENTQVQWNIPTVIDGQVELKYEQGYRKQMTLSSKVT